MTTKPTLVEPQRIVLSREDIFKASDIVTEWVSVPEWFNGNAAGGIYVQGMTTGERDQLESSMLTDKGKRNMDRMAQFRSRVLLLCCVDESGRKIFQPTDVTAISRKSMRAVERVLDVAQRLSGMTEEDVDQLTGNSNGQGDESSLT